MDDALRHRVARIDEGGAAIFALELPAMDGVLFGRLAANASPERRDRAARYRFQADAIRCLAAEALLRHALREVHGLDGDGAVAGRDTREKPFLVSHPDIQFNLSHSGAWVVCALHDRLVGIDVEEPRPMTNPPAAQFMSAPELARYHALAPGERPAGFFRLWTLKESVLKAAGTGFAFDPRQMTLSTSDARIDLEGAPDAGPGLRWSVHVVRIPAPVHAAVCLQVPAAGNVSCADGAGRPTRTPA